jgi:hypothetical protein
MLVLYKINQNGGKYPPECPTCCVLPPFLTYSYSRGTRG